MTRSSDYCSHPGLVKLLALIGAIILIVLAIFTFSFSAHGIICGLLLLIVGIVVLISCFGSARHGIPFSGVVILILGIIAILIGYFCGGLFGLIAGIIILVAGIIGVL